MTRYIVRRILLLVVTIFVTSIIVFGLTQLLPGDVARLVLGREASDIAIEEFRETHGLNQSVPEQYIDWFTGFVQGDWGTSYKRGNPEVRPLVIELLQNTLRLGTMILLMSGPLSILLGVLAALNEDGIFDSIISIFSLAVVGLPEFVTSIVLINIFANNLDIFDPISTPPRSNNFAEWIKILVLPSITATLVLLAYIARMTRAGVIDELKKPYVRTATLKGLSQRTIIVKHVLRNALLPTITVIALSIGWLIGGLVVIEEVFNYPGLGKELVSAVKTKDLPMLQSIVMLIIIAYALANLIADLVYGLLNPRIRLD